MYTLYELDKHIGMTNVKFPSLTLQKRIMFIKREAQVYVMLK